MLHRFVKISHYGHPACKYILHSSTNVINNCKQIISMPSSETYFKNNSERPLSIKQISLSVYGCQRNVDLFVGVFKQVWTRLVTVGGVAVLNNAYT